MQFRKQFAWGVAALASVAVAAPAATAQVQYTKVADPTGAVLGQDSDGDKGGVVVGVDGTKVHGGACWKRAEFFPGYYWGTTGPSYWTSMSPGDAGNKNLCADEDGDFDDVDDRRDNCPAVKNADQTDTDDDGIGDACE